jgi:hypothetical protein
MSHGIFVQDGIFPHLLHARFLITSDIGHGIFVRNGIFPGMYISGGVIASGDMKLKKQASRRVPPEKAASLEEISAAVESLSEEDLWRLEKYARYRIRGIGRAAMGRDHEDLLREAIAATCDPERRRWNIGAVSFTQHLKGVMRSVSSHWREGFDEEEATLEADAIRIGEEGEEINPLLEARSPLPDPERSLAAKEELSQIEGLVADRALAALIVGGMREGSSGPEIKELLGISQTEYETEMKWLRWNVRNKARKVGTNV